MKNHVTFSSFVWSGRARINLKELIRMSANLLCEKKFTDEISFVKCRAWIHHILLRLRVFENVLNSLTHGQSESMKNF